MEQELKKMLKTVRNRMYLERYVDREVVAVAEMIRQVSSATEMSLGEVVGRVQDYLAEHPNAHPFHALLSLHECVGTVESLLSLERVPPASESTPEPATEMETRHETRPAPPTPRRRGLLF